MTQAFMRLGELPQDQVRPLLEKGVPVYLHVNPVEYHGPHLPLNTDSILSHAMTSLTHPLLGPEITAGLPPVLAEEIPCGTNTAHGPGTEETPFRLVRKLVLRRCRALAEAGAKRVVLATFHGGPMHNLALWDGVRYLERRGVAAIAPFNIVLRNMLDLRPEELLEIFGTAFEAIEDPAWRQRIIERFTQDYHAGFFETSLMTSFKPEAVSTELRSLPPCPDYLPHPVAHAIERVLRVLGLRRAAKELHFVTMGLGWSALRPFPGYTGAPHLANPASGAAFAKALADTYARHLRAVFLECRPAPEPILQFLRTASLGGRIGP